MRIESNQNLSSLKKKETDLNKDHSRVSSFHQVLNKEKNLSTVERINNLLHQIDTAGERLSKSQMIRDLAEYKKLVKSFMEEAVKHGVGMDDREGLSRRGRTKVYKMVTEVNEKLVELTNAVLDKEQRGLDILSRVGEIKGMLVNMYL